VGKTNFTTFGPPPRKILEKSHSATLEKILPTPMLSGNNEFKHGNKFAWKL